MLVLILAGGVELYVRTQGNFHVVEEGVLYRSAQLRDYQLKKRIEEHHIASIINLRGPMSHDPRYVDEVALAQEHNITHIDMPLSAYAYYDVNASMKLLELMRNAPKPLLIHCEGGADRSALADALWRYTQMHESKTQAQEASYRWEWGYLPYGKWEAKENMRKSFLDYAQALKNDE